LEYSPKQEETLTTILALIQKAGGALICIDYGYAECGYGNTFQALKDHKYIDPLLYQGQADLTSHVNFSFFSNIAEEKGFEVTIYTQSEFLKMMGIELRYQILCKQKPEHQKILQQGLDRLINKMGYLFKVMVIKSNGKSKK
jgi:SAM-dependent MidA family methyltransferase